MKRRASEFETRRGRRAELPVAPEGVPVSRLCAILLFAASMTGVARAQGSGTIEVPDSIDAPDSPFLVTRMAKGRIAGIKHDAHFTLVLIEDTKGRRGTLKVNSRTKFKADKG